MGGEVVVAVVEGTIVWRDRRVGRVGRIGGGSSRLRRPPTSKNDTRRERGVEFDGGRSRGDWLVGRYSRGLTLMSRLSDVETRSSSEMWLWLKDHDGSREPVRATIRGTGGAGMETVAPGAEE